MSSVEITESQVIAQVRSLLRKDPGARVIGIHSAGPWQGKALLTVDEQTLHVYRCTSVLAFREQLVATTDAAVITVLLTPLDGQSLGQDVLARLCGQRLIAIQGWRIVRSLFGVDDIDARLHPYNWMADALLNSQPTAGYPPVPGRVLTLDFVWQLLLKLYLGFDQLQVDAIELARWAKNPDRVATYLRAPQEFRNSLPDWIAQTAGDVGRVMLSALEQGHGLDLIPLGLVCQVVFDPNLAKEMAIARAAILLEERFLGKKSLPAHVGQGWGAAVSSVVETDLAKRDYLAIQNFQRRAEEILMEISADAFIGTSPILPKGFERRLDQVAADIRTMITAGPEKKNLEALEHAAQRALEHHLASRTHHRADGVKMAVRLVRWLEASTQHALAGAFPEAVLAYFNDGGFVDWARARIWDGDSNLALTEAYSLLAAKVDTRREAENRNFGHLLQDWSHQATPSADLLWGETVLAQVVAPLAKGRAILLLVLDGMSMAVFRELTHDLFLQGWIELGYGDCGEHRPVIAALPTRTEIARASLLCGQLTSGNSHKEKEAFQQQKNLRAHSRAHLPPILYHKAELTCTGGRGLSPEVRADIAGTDRRVMGVIINTVDDYLASGDQFKETWTTETIVPLGQILDAARESNRIIILTSDHGHILERDLEYRPHVDGQERSRPATGQPQADEIMLQGPRIWPPGATFIAPWSEKVRFGSKKYGYHGGVSPQEVVVPLAVLHSGTQNAPEGWRETASFLPSWWEKAESETITTKPKARKSKSRKKPPIDQPQGTLDLGREAENCTEDSDWISTLLRSPIYQEQKTLTARTAPEDERVRSFLAALAARGGKMTRTALARHLGIPPMRFPGLLSGLRRLLNVDGYAILNVDDHADMVELDIALLSIQFVIKDST